VKRQRRGFVFPEEDLDKYVNVFYSLNEGRDIKHDLGSFRRNERVPKKREGAGSLGEGKAGIDAGLETKAKVRAIEKQKEVWKIV
jgi:hypothetical protein